METYDGIKSQLHACECGCSFKKACQLIYHVRKVHYAEKSHACTSCDKAFFKKSDLDSHLLTHSNGYKCVCKFCGRSFKHISNMNRHVRTHTGVKPYPCSVCSKRFSQVSALKQHSATEHHRAKCAESQKNTSMIDIPPIPDLGFVDPDDPDEDGGALESFIATRGVDEQDDKKWWFYCGICDQRFKFIGQLRLHEEEHVLKNDLMCKLCDVTFESVAALKSHGCGKTKASPHINASQGPPASQIKLENDGVEEKTAINFTTNVELTLAGNGQILLDNNEVLLIMSDKVYGAVFVNSDVTVVENDAVDRVLNGLALSQKVTGTEEKSGDENSYACELPSSIAAVESADVEEKEKLLLLQLWMMDQKIGEKEEPSKEEGPVNSVATSKSKSSLPKLKCTECGRIFHKKHNYQQHLGTHFVNQQRYECPICNRHFAWKSTVGKHIAREHGERNEYTCDQCGKVYSSSITVQYHIQRDHLNIRKHKCSKCDRVFFRKCDLQLHFRKHNDEKPYICGVCGKRFRHSSNNLRHERLHLKHLTETNSTLERLQKNVSTNAGY